MIEKICKTINDLISKKYDIDLYSIEHELVELRLLVADKATRLVASKNILEVSKTRLYKEYKEKWEIKSEAWIETAIKNDLVQEIAGYREMEAEVEELKATVFAYIRFCDAVREEKISQATQAKIDREMQQLSSNAI